jgi:predicted ATP-grasp superfamily ATP-dependent carboligase
VSSLYELRSDRPSLSSPVLVMAPEGWIDAGLGGAGAMAALVAGMETEVVATFDGDALLDLRARRPVAHIVDGVYQDLVWPDIELRAGKDEAGHDVLLLVGPEPDNAWRAFSEAVGELATLLEVRLLVGMGAFPAPVPHTRPAKLVATATTAELAAQVGVFKGNLNVPAGIVLALQRHFGDIGLPAIALWSRVPHYAASLPYPEASVVLLDGLARVADITVDSAELRAAAEAARIRLDELTANSAEHQALVAQLEAQMDAEEKSGAAEASTEWPEPVPGGDDLVAEVERFLREQPGQGE